ncbi:hypothetical protein RhiirC2_789900 [Rhizophagus irregularis]|uniref:Uncharacterized protein n=1 Tax=Rhizophagus irregularis TaxID=588596 RepID=A0A2N1MM86_9GLOM|nr:hypothetical protein RhiirC2_789900 [Rhizophagus irregularis]
MYNENKKKQLSKVGVIREETFHKRPPSGPLTSQTLKSVKRRPEVSLDRQAVWLLWTQDFGERPGCVVQGNQLQYEYRNPGLRLRDWQFTEKWINIIHYYASNIKRQSEIFYLNTPTILANLLIDNASNTLTFDLVERVNKLDLFSGYTCR